MARSRSGKGRGSKMSMPVGRKAGGQNYLHGGATKRGGPSGISKIVGSRGGATVGKNVDQFPAQYSYTGGRTPASIGKVSTSGNKSLGNYSRGGK